MEFRESQAGACPRAVPSVQAQLAEGHFTAFADCGFSLSISHPSLLLLQIVKEAYPDHTQFDQKDPHYDSSSRKENPKWSMVM